MTRRSCCRAFVLLALALPMPAQAAPMLTFVGTAEQGPGSDGEHTWLVDAAGDGAAEDLGAGRIDVADVFDGDWLVCRSGWPKTHYVLLARRPGDDGQRARRTLVPGGHCETVPQFVDVQHRRLYVLSPRWGDRAGSLRAFEVDGPQAGRELLDRVQTVVARSLDGLFVLRDAETPGDRELWFVPRQPGGARRVLDVALRVGSQGLGGDAAFSPDRRHLAIGVQALDGTGGSIWVVDAIAGALVAHLEGIRLDVSPLSSQIPTVTLSWPDAQTLRYSRTADDGFEWVTWSLVKREELGAERYGPVGLHHERPPVPVADDGALRVDDAGVWFVPRAGEAEGGVAAPVVPRPAAGWWGGDSKLLLCPDGRHAAWSNGGELTVIDGPRRRARACYRGSVEFPQWLPDRS